MTLIRLLCRSGALILASIGVTLCLFSSGPNALVVLGHGIPYVVLHDATALLTKRAHSDDGRKGTSSCTTLQVLLTKDDIQAGQWLENNGIPAPGVRFGGSIPLTNPDNDNEKLGTYTYLLTFLPNNDCIATGAYIFTSDEDDNDDYVSPSQITFTATCQALPYFTISGGQGPYQGATGHVQYQIPDGTRGYRHAIHVCSA